MTFCFHILTILTLIIIQTTIMPYHGFLQGFYDLPLLFVIYLGLYRPMREGIPTVIVLGFIMDSLSGSPLGIYMTSYAWIYGGCIWFLTLFQVYSRLLLLLIVAVAVIFENIIFISGLFFQADRVDFINVISPTIAIQILWAMVTAPWIIILFGKIQGYLTRWYNAHRMKQNGQH